MRLYIKNMVCNRCKAAVSGILTDAGLHPLVVELGEVEVEEAQIMDSAKQVLGEALISAGFELIDDRASRLIEAIKATIVRLVHHSEEPPTRKYSEILSESLHHEYSGLSKLFSETEGITIEQYIIQQKIERVKELLVYDELSLTEIAWQTGYSSTAHLSAQFKKVTGMTPSVFKSLHRKHRIPLDEIGR
jgi:AraC-like DNA-binding protein